MPPAELQAYARHRPRVEAERKLQIFEALLAAQMKPRDRARWHRSVLRAAGIAGRPPAGTARQIAASGGAVVNEPIKKRPKRPQRKEG